MLPSGLTFGTAGLRAAMEAGFNRLNSLTIIQTSQGLAEFLLEHERGAMASGIVIGYDGRHNSKKFAQLAAAAFNAKNIRVWMYEDVVHTPLVPFAVRHLHAAAGIMITASHNPAQDNGYKVYGSNGCQINSPVDVEIARFILNNLEPITWNIEVQEALQESILAPLTEKYLETLVQYINSWKKPGIPPRFVYTPMHGVGLRIVTMALKNLDVLGTMVLVEEQAQPNPDFPTVRYPNPEEDGALELAKSTADRKGICLVLANDPDADRFAVAEKIGNEWKQLTGDQVGILIASHIVSNITPRADQHDVLLTSAVSSEMLSFMSAEEGFASQDTLTGFKWLGNCARFLEEKGERVHFAYEEALGYMFPNIVGDKDGIAAATYFLHACAEWGSPWAKLQQLYQKYGYFETMNTYWRTPDTKTTKLAFENIRRLGTPFPTSMGARKVLRWRDLTEGYDSLTDGNVPSLPSSAASQMITCWLSAKSNDDGIRFTIRASGTEPKIKSELNCRCL